MSSSLRIYLLLNEMKYLAIPEGVRQDLVLECIDKTVNNIIPIFVSKFRLAGLFCLQGLKLSAASVYEGFCNITSFYCITITEPKSNHIIHNLLRRMYVVKLFKRTEGKK